MLSVKDADKEKEEVVVLAIVLTSLIALVVAGVVVTVAWLGGKARKSSDSRFVKMCETISDCVNGDVEPPETLSTLAEIQHGK